jgi:uncharacterized protein involved in response to NO
MLSPNPRDDGAQQGRTILLARGFRPFFLLASAHAVLFLPVWSLIALGILPAPSWATPSLWHAHEMIYGFALAAAAGFLLTAVPVWTGGRPVEGRALLVLVALWLAGRVALAAAGALPLGVVAVVDLALPTALAFVLARPLLAPNQRHNRLFLAALALLVASSTGFHVHAAGVLQPLLGARVGLVAVDIFVVLVVLVGGRIIPAFTHNALQRAGSARRVTSLPWLDRVSIALVWALVIADGAGSPAALAATVRVLAAAALLMRMAGWQTIWTRRDPLLWSLHAGFAWLPVGLVLLAFWQIDASFPRAAGLHALGIGGFGTMILAVMSRVSLGHTGRPLTAPRPMTFAYLAVTASAGIRVAGALLPSGFALSIPLSAALFALAFATFLWVYAPILASARVDGRAG